MIQLVLARVHQWLSLATAGSMLCSYLAPWVCPRTFLPPALLAIGYPYLVFANLGFTGFWLVRGHRRRAAISLGAVLVGGGYLMSYIGVHRRSGPPPADHCVHVMTFNANYFDVLRSRNAAAMSSCQAIIQTLEAERPAVLCGQDFSADGEVGQPIFSAIDRDLGLHQRFQDSDPLVTFTGLPIAESKSVTFPGTHNSFSYVDVRVGPERWLRFFNIHLQSYSIDVTRKGDARPLGSDLNMGLVVNRRVRSYSFSLHASSAIACDFYLP